MRHTIHNADVLDALAEAPDERFDAVFCDPPYGLNFMGRRWDHGVPSTEVWAEVLRVLKPGASLMAFGGTRTYHRLAVNIEDAGFELRDCFMWLYGTGFPKGYDISKGLAAKELTGGAGPEAIRRASMGDAYEPSGRGRVNYDNGGGSKMNGNADADLPSSRFDGYKTALKPAWEPIVWAMKPLDGTYADNALTHGVAGLNVDGGRIDYQSESDKASARPSSFPKHHEGFGEAFNIRDRSERDPEKEQNDEGRYPANVILDPIAADQLDRQAGELTSGSGPREEAGLHGDTGGASRFFYTAKASRAEREAGLLDFATDTTDDGRDTPIDNPYQRGKTERRNTHPTVKPVDLCRYFSTLLLPPERDTPRRILTPFSGVGSEMIGNMLAGWNECVGIEKNAEYIDIARARLGWWREHGAGAIDAHKAEQKRRKRAAESGQQPLFKSA